MPEKSDHDLLMEIHTTLLGANGQGGLCRDFESVKRDYYYFKRKVLAVFFFLLGSGVLGAAIFEVAKRVG